MAKLNKVVIDIVEEHLIEYNRASNIRKTEICQTVSRTLNNSGSFLNPRQVRLLFQNKLEEINKSMSASQSRSAAGYKAYDVIEARDLLKPYPIPKQIEELLNNQNNYNNIEPDQIFPQLDNTTTNIQDNTPNINQDNEKSIMEILYNQTRNNPTLFNEIIQLSQQNDTFHNQENTTNIQNQNESNIHKQILDMSPQLKETITIQEEIPQQPEDNTIHITSMPEVNQNHSEHVPDTMNIQHQINPKVFLPIPEISPQPKKTIPIQEEIPQQPEDNTIHITSMPEVNQNHSEHVPDTMNIQHQINPNSNTLREDLNQYIQRANENQRNLGSQLNQEEEELEEEELEEEEIEEPVIGETARQFSNAFLSIIDAKNEIFKPEQVEGLIGVHTERDLLTNNNKLPYGHVILLESDLKSQCQLFSGVKAIEFLSGLDCTDYHIDNFSHHLKHKLKIQLTPKIANRITFHNRIDVSKNGNVFLQIFFTDDGAYFAFSILLGGYLNMLQVTFDRPAFSKGRYPKGYIFLPLENTAPHTIINPFGYQDNEIIRRISGYLLNQKNVGHVDRGMAYFCLGVSPPARRLIELDKILSENKDSTIYTNLQDIFDFFQDIEGFTLLFSEQDGHYLYNNQNIKAFIWIPKSTFEILKKDRLDISCLELDVSFKATQPQDVYCVPQLVYRNVGIPIALIVGPTECFELYNLLYYAFDYYDKKHKTGGKFFNKIKKFSILTDMHAAFTKLSKEYNLDHYYCISHILRNYGASSVMSILVRNILFSHSKEQFEENKNNYKELLKLFIQYGSQTVGKRLDDFQKDILSFDETQFQGKDAHLMKKFSPLYYRMKKHIPTTTNHSERFHRTINHFIHGKKPARFKHHRIFIIIKCILDSINSMPDRLFRQIREHINERKNYAFGTIKPQSRFKILAEPIDQRAYSNKQCYLENCFDKIYTTYKFGTNNISCLHCILNGESEKKELKDFIPDLLIIKNKVKNFETYREVLPISEYPSGMPKWSLKNERDGMSFITINPLNRTDFNHPITAMIARIYLALTTTLKKISLYEVCDYCVHYLTLWLPIPQLYAIYRNHLNTFINNLTVVIIKTAYQKHNKLKEF